MSARSRQLPAHKNMLFVGGALLVALGVGNWVTGIIRTRPYLEYLRDHPGPRSSVSVKADLLAPPDEERQERDVARAKLEFYLLVQTGGRLMVLLGSLCLSGGWLARRLRAYPSLLPSR